MAQYAEYEINNPPPLEWSSSPRQLRVQRLERDRVHLLGEHRVKSCIWKDASGDKYLLVGGRASSPTDRVPIGTAERFATESHRLACALFSQFDSDDLTPAAMPIPFGLSTMLSSTSMDQQHGAPAVAVFRLSAARADAASSAHPIELRWCHLIDYLRFTHLANTAVNGIEPSRVIWRNNERTSLSVVSFDAFQFAQEEYSAARRARDFWLDKGLTEDFGGEDDQSIRTRQLWDRRAAVALALFALARDEPLPEGPSSISERLSELQNLDSRVLKSMEAALDDHADALKTSLTTLYPGATRHYAIAQHAVSRDILRLRPDAVFRAAEAAADRLKHLFEGPIFDIELDQPATREQQTQIFLRKVGSGLGWSPRGAAWAAAVAILTLATFILLR